MDIPKLVMRLGAPVPDVCCARLPAFSHLCFARNSCLAKPYLRAHMETDCKAIMDGSKDADTVKHACLEDMYDD